MSSVEPIATDRPAIGLLSGTGPAGTGLAVRLADAGVPVALGSRDRARAAEHVEALQNRWGAQRLATLTAASNAEAATSDIVVVCTRADEALATVGEHREALNGSLVVSIAARMTKAARGMQADPPSAGSMAGAIQTLLPDARVVATMHHLPGESMVDLDLLIAADVLMCSDDKAAVAEVASRFGVITSGRFLDAGVLQNAIALEAMTAALVTVNITTRSRSTIALIDTSSSSEI